MHRFFLFGRVCRLMLLAASFVLGTAHARPECLTVFDVGSSGVRTGNSETDRSARAPLEFLRTVWATGTLDTLVPDLVKAFNDLPKQAQYEDRCLKLAGGFSAWRLALEKNPQALIAVLEKVRRDTGVYVVVIPQSVEGGYAWVGAKQRLGSDLKTDFVLDVGGGSFQLSSQNDSIGLALGQKSNRRAICQGLQLEGGDRCMLLPLSTEQRVRGRDLLIERLKGAGSLSTRNIEVTAVSRPVTRGVLPFANRILNLDAGNRVFTAQQISDVSTQLSRMTLPDVTRMMGGESELHEYLMSDLILLEAVTQFAGVTRLHVLEANINNVPGLMLDPQLRVLSANYACYLDLLNTVGIQAYRLAGPYCAGSSFWDQQPSN